MKLVRDENAWADYVRWQTQNRKTRTRINTLIEDVQRNGNEGFGRPGSLEHGFHGSWPRRITGEHRLVRKVDEDESRIAACRCHYEHRAAVVNTLRASSAALARISDRGRRRVCRCGER